MGFDTQHGVVYGLDARRVRSWAKFHFCTWLAAKLNDANGPYAATLGITSQRQARVTGVMAVAKALYDKPGSPPVVMLMNGPDDIMRSGQTIGGTFYKGARHNLTFALDCGVNDAQPDNDNLTNEQDADAMLADFILDAVRRSYQELSGLGLGNLQIKPDMEKQRAGEGRNPHTLTCCVLALDDYQPSG